MTISASRRQADDDQPRLAGPWLTAPYQPTHPVSTPCRIGHEQPCGDAGAHQRRQGLCFGDDRLYSMPPLLGFDIPADLRGEEYVREHLESSLWTGAHGADTGEEGASAPGWREFLGPWLRDPTLDALDVDTEVHAANRSQADLLARSLHRRLTLALRGQHYDIDDLDTLRYTIDLLQRLALSMRANPCPTFVPWTSSPRRPKTSQSRASRIVGGLYLDAVLGGVPLAILDRASLMVAETLPDLAAAADGAWTRHIAHVVLWAELNGGAMALSDIERAYADERFTVHERLYREHHSSSVDQGPEQAA